MLKRQVVVIWCVCGLTKGLSQPDALLRPERKSANHRGYQNERRSHKVKRVSGLVCCLHCVSASEDKPVRRKCQVQVKVLVVFWRQWTFCCESVFIEASLFKSSLYKSNSTVKWSISIVEPAEASSISSEVVWSKRESAVSEIWTPNENCFELCVCCIWMFAGDRWYNYRFVN